MARLSNRTPGSRDAQPGLGVFHPELAGAILACVQRGGGAESVSYIQQCLREDGWRRLGPLADFEGICRALGFKTIEGRNERGQRRIEVSL